MLYPSLSSLWALILKHLLSTKEYAIIAVVPLLSSFFLVMALLSDNKTSNSDHFVAIGISVVFFILGLLALCIGYKTQYTFDGNAVTFGRIFWSKFAWSIPYMSIDAVRVKRSQHLEYLQITAKDGQEYNVRLIDTLKAIIDDLPEPDKYLI